MNRKLTVVVVAVLALAAVSRAQSAGFERRLAQIKTQPGESLYRQIDWLTSVWAARLEAADSGKPIFIWAGSGGGPVGVC
jgi:hypothetical protein